jgi:hypothetical protein
VVASRNATDTIAHRADGCSFFATGVNDNLLGRVYLASILPFHRLVVRALLRQVAA